MYFAQKIGRSVEGVEGLWRVVVDSSTRANTGLLIVWRVTSTPYTCARACACVYVTIPSTLSTLSTILLKLYKKQLLNLWRVCLKFNQTLHKPSTGLNLAKYG